MSEKSIRILNLLLLTQVILCTYPVLAADENAPLPPGNLSKRLNPGLEQEPFSNLETKSLKPLAEIADGQIEASAIIENRGKVKSLQFIKISVKNLTDRPLSFDGDEAGLDTGKAQLKALPLNALDNRIKEPDNPKGYAGRSLANTISAAVSVGAVQTIEGEMRLLGPMPRRYGYDNERRHERQLRFGNRVLFPGDASEGFIYFRTAENLQNKFIELPLKAFYDEKDSYRLRIPIK